MANGTAETLSVLAALVSAVGTVFAARAAFKSAESAKAAQTSTQEMERRNHLHNIALLSVDSLAEMRRLQFAAEATKVAYNDLAVFTGNVGSNRVEMCKNKIAEKLDEAQQKAAYAQLFRDPFEKLKHAPSSEMDRIHTALVSNQRELSVLRAELDEECSYVQSQCAQHREKAIGDSSR